MRLFQIDKAILLWGLINEEVLSLFKKEDLLGIPESRPYLYGLKNIFFLKNKGYNCFYLTDNMVGILFVSGKIKSTYIFYKEKSDKGFLCPSGSLYVYLLSRLHNIEVNFFPQGELEKSLDKDASTLGGKPFVKKEDLKFVVLSQDELIGTNL